MDTPGPCIKSRTTLLPLLLESDGDSAAQELSLQQGVPRDFQHAYHDTALASHYCQCCSPRDTPCLSCGTDNIGLAGPRMTSFQGELLRRLLRHERIRKKQPQSDLEASAFSCWQAYLPPAEGRPVRATACS